MNTNKRLGDLERAVNPDPIGEYKIILSWEDDRFPKAEIEPGDKVINLTWGDDENDTETD